MPGPAPSANPRRRNVRPDSTTLPASGYAGEIPEWPLAVPMDIGEEVAWRSLWRSPQAAAWAQLAIVRTVARYCRVLVASEVPGAPATYLTEVRQLEDRLGLTAMSMLRLRWVVSTDELGAARAGTATTAVTAVTHLRAVE
jgi:hypothetical protein